MRIETTESRFNKDNYRKAELVKTDRNGTKTYHVIGNCSRCGGQGYIPYYYFNDRGICYKCLGRCVEHHTVIVRTEEYAAKLKANRDERAYQKKLKEDEIGKKEIIARMQKRVVWIKNCKNGPCKECKHKSYCSLIKDFLHDYSGVDDYQSAAEYCPHAYGNLVRDISKTTEFLSLLEEIMIIDSQPSTYTEPHEEPEIVTLDNQPCRVSKWYETEYGKCRTIFLPDGSKIYSGATTNKGLKRKGVMLNPNYRGK